MMYRIATIIFLFYIAAFMLLCRQQKFYSISILPCITFTEALPAFKVTVPKPVAVERKEVKSPALESTYNVLSTAS